MGFFSSRKTTALPWNYIESVDQLNEILGDISDKPKLLFKHSTRCSISSMVLNSFENDWTSGNDKVEIYFIDLLKHRDVSNEIATLTGVTHQSPQAIVVKGKEVIYDASHSGINGRKIEALVNQ